MSSTFAQYLADLDEATLNGVLRARPDVLRHPLPQGFEQLADRLSGRMSLGPALFACDRDIVNAGKAVAALGSPATVGAVADLLGASETAVREVVRQLCARGMAWWSGETIRLPDALTGHFGAEIGGGRPVTKLVKQVRVDELRLAVEALGGSSAGLRKPELVERLLARYADTRALISAVEGLPPAAERQLRERCRGEMFFGLPVAVRAADKQLERAGLLFRVGYGVEVPREVAVAVWLTEQPVTLTGRPDLPAAEVDTAAQQRGAQAAVQQALQAVTTLLDHASRAPLAALKKGGVGTRERRRLEKALSLSDIELWIDLAAAARLLAPSDNGYAPTSEYADWRSAGSARRWAMLAGAWFGLDHAPTSREVQDDKELPPPLPLASAAGLLRRGLLVAARDGALVSAATGEIEWFCPLHGYEEELPVKLAAAVREGELLGVIASGTLTDLGRLLVDDPSPDELAQRSADLLPDAPCTVILQSDLTAVVSGQPGAPVARLLAESAVAETRGTAATWRFSPDSIRGALDAGWDADELVAQLERLSGRPVPQPLRYLVGDVARRHGAVRVRGVRSCVIADEAMATEILHTRALRKLHLSRLAPTVLAGPRELDDVLAALRAAGFAPVAEDAQGVAIVEARVEHQAMAAGPALVVPDAVTPEELAKQLIADPAGSDADESETMLLLAAMNPRLTEAELSLLADAVDQQRDIVIGYRDKKGTRSVRPIQPRDLYGRWLDSWCHLRNAQRDFAVANIESVSPAG